MRFRALSFVILASACAGATPEVSSPRTTEPVRAAAIAGVDDPRLRELLIRDWELSLREDPVFATSVGDHRYDDRIGDPSWAHILEVRAAVRQLLDEARAIPAAALSPRDRTLLDIYIDKAEANVAAQVCDLELWNIGPAGANPFGSLTQVPNEHVVTTPADAVTLLARYRAMPAWLDAVTANVRRGAQAGKVATAALIRGGIAAADLRLAVPFPEWELAAPGHAPHPDWTAEQRASFQRDVDAALPPIRAALQRYRDALEHDLLPHGRDEAHAGLVALPDGLACYRAMIRQSTSLSMSPEELNKLGMDEVARGEREFAVLGQKLFATSDLAKIHERLRSDPALYYHDSATIQREAEETIERTRVKLPQYFGILPKAVLRVRAMDPAEAASYASPFYQRANTDGTKPGEYRINLSKPDIRSRWDAENSAFHEGLPGHHLQMSIAQELSGVPAFLKYGDMTAFIEGWALYSERLADEMGLYSNDMGRLGMVEWDVVRGARLVVDSGLHGLGWSPEKARQYFHDHTAMTDADIAQEIDRYITAPSQALAYKVGDLTIRRLRKHAQDELGAKFDVRGFHDVVLGGGAVTLGVLEKRVDEWIAATKAR